MNPTSARIKSKKKRIVEHRNRDLTYRHCGRIKSLSCAYVERKLLRFTVEERVKNVILEKLAVNSEKVIPTANFVYDLEADSLDQIELIMAIEDEFNIDISDDDAEKILTVQDAYNYINKFERMGMVYQFQNSRKISTGELGRYL